MTKVPVILAVILKTPNLNDHLKQVVVDKSPILTSSNKMYTLRMDRSTYRIKMTINKPVIFQVVTRREQLS